ncbi:cyclic AMP-dependent transcription factor ATF-1-like isoform X3 [Centruroides vittatus]|uniref:cyclic AMP-dependent transcription factor ATF-1-like isoform X3 n=1 Tax=Centruroides vittatus TaxID=120091 RepID=UPI00350F8570
MFEINLRNDMDSLVDEQGSTLHIGDRALSSPTSPGGDRDNLPVSSSGSQVRSNGAVLFTTPSQVNQVRKAVGSGGSTAQAIALPQPGGAVSIVHVTLPNQPVHVQSVIQPGPNQQSVIQTTGGNTLQSMQLISASKGDDGETVTLALSDEESKKRREILARRPSYRKILNDLSSTEAQGAVVSLTGNSGTTVKEETGNANGGNDATNQESESGTVSGNTITVAGTQYHTAPGILKVLPASAIQLASQDGSIQGLQTIAMANSGSGTAGTIVQYAQGQDGQFFVPVTVSAADLQAYQIRTTGSTGSGGLTHGVVMAPSSNLNQQHTVVEDASRKRELRLLKNREAAKECRRKKKEYIKCLENRVAVLENQNKALIEELKSLKELYCQKTE